MKDKNNHRKPPWLRVRIPAGEGNSDVMSVLQKYGLHTVCQSALCPNRGECFGSGTATFMIMGDTCTRNCGYCGVAHGTPKPLDWNEPANVAGGVAQLGLSYVVITSVTRDDAGPEGARFFAETVRRIREMNPDTDVEVLIPDFGGDLDPILDVIRSGPVVVGHNIEVTRSLFEKARPQGDYVRSLNVLRIIKEHTVAKSGFMLGLGETDTEIEETLRDLSEVAHIVTIGQYLQPTKTHLPVMKYYEPEEFEKWAKVGLKMGFRHVESGPLVRSSYHAGEYGQSS